MILKAFCLLLVCSFSKSQIFYQNHEKIFFPTDPDTASRFTIFGQNFQTFANPTLNPQNFKQQQQELLAAHTTPQPITNVRGPTSQEISEAGKVQSFNKNRNSASQVTSQPQNSGNFNNNGDRSSLDNRSGEHSQVSPPNNRGPTRPESNTPRVPSAPNNNGQNFGGPTPQFNGSPSGSPQNGFNNQYPNQYAPTNNVRPIESSVGTKPNNQPQYNQFASSPNSNGFTNGNQGIQQSTPDNNGRPFASSGGKRPVNAQSSGSNESNGPKFEDYKPVTRFAWQLFKVSNTPPHQNLVMCPLSPQLLLSYLAFGSQGQTKKEITRAISYNEPKQVEDLMRSMLNEGGNRELQFATAFFIANNINLHPQFRSNDAIEVISTDFSQPQRFQNDYNRWASSKTKGALPLIQAQPNPATKMILSSAVYFKGGWIYKFNPAQIGTFYTVDNRPVSIPMMTLRKKLPYGSIGEMAEWVSIPYNSTDSMVVIKPRPQHSAESLIVNLQPRDIEDVMESLHRDNYANVNLTMPKFKTDSTTSLVNSLKQMGIRKCFSGNSEITKLASEPLQVSNALQQASLEVNEEGSIATSLTSFSVVALSFSPPVPNVEFTVDRPFIAMIVNRDRKFPYFVAKISAP